MSDSTAISIRDDQVTFDDLQTRALAHIGMDKLNKADLAVFFHTCKRTGLDPFARQIYMIERWTTDGPKQTIQTGIDGFRLIAQRTCQANGERLGYEDTLWCDDSGQWRDVWLSDGPPSAAKVVITRDGARFPGVALYAEYVGRKRDGSPTKMWTEKGALMLAKCAEALALRRAFPLDLSGIYTSDEIQDHRPQPAPAQTISAADFAPVVNTETGEVTDAEEVES